LCFDTAEALIEVKCSVFPSFEANPLFASTDTVVQFYNRSQNATAYEWIIDGTPVSRSKDFQRVFARPGEYKVCLKASNAYCEQTYCTILWVAEEVLDSANCSKVFVNTFGDPRGEDEAHAIVFLGDGSFIVGGSHSGKSALYFFNKKGKLVKNIDLGITNQKERISNMIKLNDEKLLCIGHTDLKSNTNLTYIFLFDIKSENIRWSKVISSNVVQIPRLYDLLKLPNGNALVVGQVSSKLNCIAFIMEINPLSGNIVWERSSTTHGCDNFTSVAKVNDNFYLIGRFNSGNSATFPGMRPTLTKISKSGSLIFQKDYLAPPNKTARLYNKGLIEDNGLVFPIYGDPDDDNLNKSKLYLAKVDYSGKMKWLRQYDFNANGVFAKNIMNTPAGYVLFGHYNYSGRNRAIFVIYTDKSGNVIWAKSIKIGEHNIAGNITWHNGYFNIVGFTNIFGQRDAFWMRLDQNGRILNSCPGYVKNISVEVNTIQKPFERNFNSNYYTSNIPYTDVYPRTIHRLAVDSILCKTADCIDTCDIAADAAIRVLDFLCVKDSFQVHAQICNTGNTTLPQGVPIRVYPSDPATFRTTPISTYFLRSDVHAGKCIIVSLKVKAHKDQTLYFTINDSGGDATPFNFQNRLTPTHVLECNFTNNWDALELSTPDFTLNLGSDTVLCKHMVRVLDAGPGFVSYRWQDGSTQQTFTAWEPGMYWVEVTDACGFTYRDTIVLREVSGTPIDLGKDTTICIGDTLHFQLKGYSNIQWSLKGFISCDTCNNVIIYPANPDTIVVKALNSQGCPTDDTLRVLALPQFQQFDTFVICAGDSLSYHGKVFREEGDYIVSFHPKTTCDSTYYLRLSLIEPTVTDLGVVKICKGDSVPALGRTISIAGLYTDTLKASNDCDSIVKIQVLLYPEHPMPLTGDTLLCDGDTAILKAAPELDNIQWTTGQSSQKISVNKSGVYGLRAIDTNGCTVEAHLQVRFVPPPTLNLDVMHESCRDSSDGSIHIIPPPNTDSLQYFINDKILSTTQITNLPPGTYVVKVVDTLGCQRDSSVTIHHGTEIEVQLGEDIVIDHLDTLLTIYAYVSKGKAVQFSWYVDGEELSDRDSIITITPRGSHTIRVVVVDHNGCTSADELLITFDVSTQIYVPNAFSPNGDGVNDQFSVFSKNGVAIIDRMAIYDRWGELIYEQFNLTTDGSETRFWDGTFKGKKLMPGVYAYIIEYHLITGEQGIKKGNVILLR